jgi:hypothetical protein
MNQSSDFNLFNDFCKIVNIFLLIFIYFIIYCITTELVIPPVSILSFIALRQSWFYHLYLFYHLLHFYKVGSSLADLGAWFDL